jgi:simple sugar transport system permease protein
MGIALVRRERASRATVAGVSLLSIFLASLVIAIVFLAYGIDPLKAAGALLKEIFGSVYGLSEVAWQSIPLILCGGGLLLAFGTSFWNIGAEGQLLAGAIAAAWVALFSGVPGFLHVPALFCSAFCAGALWGFVPTLLRAKFKIPEVITTLMLNYVAANLVLYLIHGPWKGEKVFGFAYTDTFPKSAWLPVIGTSRIHWPTLAIAIALLLAIHVVTTRTRLGYEIKVVSRSPEAGRYARISYFRTILTVMLISGGAAGLAGAGEVAGVHHLLRHPDQVSLGYGYTAIVVAWLARGNPFAVVLTALLMGLILVAGDVIQISYGFPFSLIKMFTGLILFFLIAGDLLVNYRATFAKGERP